CTLEATLKSLRPCALCRWSSSYPHLCRSNCARGLQFISSKSKSGNDLSATELVVEGQHTCNRRDSRGNGLAIAHASAWRLPTLSRSRNTDGAQAQAKGEGL